LEPAHGLALRPGDVREGLTVLQAREDLLVRQPEVASSRAEEAGAAAHARAAVHRAVRAVLLLRRPALALRLALGVRVTLPDRLGRAGASEGEHYDGEDCECRSSTNAHHVPFSRCDLRWKQGFLRRF